jgi:hypothetical protein
MSAGARVAAFVALLVAIFACALLAGRALRPDGHSGRVHTATVTRVVAP